MDAEPSKPADAERLASGHYENFAVLSPMLSPERRAAFATVYAYCRGLDDVADAYPGAPATAPPGGWADAPDEAALAAVRERALAGLTVWRSAVNAAFEGEPEAVPTGEPAFHAAPPDLWHRLAALARDANLDREPFLHLIEAFERDQRQAAYESFDDLLTYCAKSADPVGRIVLKLIGADPKAPEHAEIAAASDRVCTALQLVNHWQDVRKDLLKLGRVYLPTAETGLSPGDLRAMAATPSDPDARVRFIKALRPLVRRTRAMFEENAALPRMLIDAGVERREAGAVHLFIGGGLAAVRSVERVGCATLWERARVGKSAKLRLLIATWIRFSHVPGRRSH